MVLVHNVMSLHFFSMQNARYAELTFFIMKMNMEVRFILIMPAIHGQNILAQTEIYISQKMKY